MPQFSKLSRERLQTCHQDLQKVMNEAIKEFDFMILCGHRGEKEQNEAFAKGTSKVKFPNSRHNKMPSMAVDCGPYPLDWDDLAAFYRMAEVIKRCAKKLKINIIWGGDWKTFKDFPHFQLT